MNKIEYNVRVQGEGTPSKKDAWLSLSLSLSGREGGVVRPETRAEPHDQRNGKARGENGTDEIVRQ